MRVTAALVVSLFAPGMFTPCSFAGPNSAQWLQDTATATTLHMAHDADGALAIYNRVLDEIEAAGEVETDPVVPRILNGIAYVHQDRGDFVTAEREYRRALNLYTAADRLRDSYALHITCNLGTLYFESRQFGRLRELGETAREALAVATAESPEIARLNHLVAMAFRIDSRFQDAEKYLLEALRLWRKFPRRVEARADTLNSLGTIAYQDGRDRVALGYLTEALDAYNAVGLGASPLVAATLTNLACVYAHMHRIADAEVNVARALAILGESRGVPLPHPSDILVTFSTALEDVGEKKRAKDYRRRAEALAPLEAAGDPTRHVVDITDLSRERSGS